MKTSKFTTVSILIILTVVLVLVAWLTQRVVTKRTQVESAAGTALLAGDDRAENFLALSGNPIDVANLVGERSLYINSWASWSPLSRDELITLNQLAGEYKDKEISFIALNRSETRSHAESYLATLPPLDNLVVVIDSTDHFYKEVGGYAMPETLIYTQDGDLWRHERQPLNQESMRAILNEYFSTEN